MVIIVMGVTGCGKTTVGKRLAETLHWPFYDADEFHPPANIEKMRSGVPLTDADRWPWLDRLRALIDQTLTGASAAGANRQNNAVLACSALRKAYRDRLTPSGTGVQFVYLRISPELARARLKARPSHYMPASLVESQFAVLEEPPESPTVLWLDAAEAVELSVQHVLRRLKLLPP
jgi:gluconokinase